VAVDVTSPVPTWARLTIYGGAGAFGVLNLTLSSFSIGHLAHEHLDLGLGRAIALALTPDAGALVAGTLWVACTGHLRTWGRNASLGLVTGSVVGNAADILASAGHVTSPVLVTLAVLLAVAAPVLALIMGHLVLLVQAAPRATSGRGRAVTVSKGPGKSTRRDGAVLSGPPKAVTAPEVAEVDGVTVELLPIPEDATAEARQRIQAANRQRKNRAKKQQVAA